ncbi:hypothetical protein SteCoe_10987 [Stentor coeruleus]|uniref:Uncharacterized protein n=1 Tax=Stentor coeruleus TaxID=5963 RepID=A0A1R2CE78_9CILI|nr:hypothetical protein SteCoe_10987 [Stentor coeruleus]
MSDTAIVEKIRKIRQELYNFNLDDQESSENYIVGGLDIKIPDLNSDYFLSSPDYDHYCMKNSQSAESFKTPDDFCPSPVVIGKGQDIEKYDLPLIRDIKNIQGKNDELGIRKCSELEEKLERANENYMKIISEKDEKIASLQVKFQRAEYDLNLLKQNSSEIESLKSSTQDLLNKNHSLDIEKSALAKENSLLKSQISDINKTLQALENKYISSQEENIKLKSDKTIQIKKYEEIKNQNEILYKTIQNYKKNKNFSTNSSPRKHRSPLHTRKTSLKTYPRKNSLSEDEKTERKVRSPSVKKNYGHPPRSKSRDKDYETNHFTCCKVIKDIMSLYNIESQNLLVSMVRSSIQEGETLKLYKDFAKKVQKIVVSNSPPNAFKNVPGLKSMVKWVKRLVKEYLGMKSSCGGLPEKKILDVLKNGLNILSNDDIPKAISRLLVENERLLVILSKVKKAYKLGSNTSLEDLEKEITVRVL